MPRQRGWNLIIIVINFLPLKKDDVPQTSGERTSQGKHIHSTDVYIKIKKEKNIFINLNWMFEFNA